MITYLEHVCHFNDVTEGGAFGPLVHDVHHEGLEALYVLVFLEVNFCFF